MATIGIDFGTTNSRVFYKRGDGDFVSLLRNKNGETIDSVRSILLEDNNEILCGNDIIGLNQEYEINIKKQFHDLVKHNIYDAEIYNKVKVFFEYLISEANKTLANWYSENTYVDKVILSKPNLTVNYQAEIKKIVESINIKNSNRKIEVIAVLDEAVSVAVNKFDDISTGDERNILVVDIGGGTTDISGVKYDGKQFSVIVNSGIDNAGSWLDDNIYRYLLRKSNVSPTNNERLKLRNLEECRAAKELAENFNQRNFQIFDSNNIKRDVILTHKEYEEILLKFYQQVEMLLSKTINECKVRKIDLEYVIYAGGTCSSNMLRGLINSKFNLMDISYNEDFKVATAKGNARYVSMNNDLHNIINYSFGVDMMSRCNGELTAGIENLIFKGGLLLK